MSSLVVTHSFTPIAVLLSSALIFIYLRRTTLFLQISALFLVWYLYEATLAFRSGIEQWWTLSLGSIWTYFRLARYEAPMAVGRALWRTSQLSYALLYIPLLITSGILLLRGRAQGQHRRQAVLLILWLTGLSFIVFVPLGEHFIRIYHFGLVPTVAIVLLNFVDRRLGKALISFVMLITLALNMPAHYGAEASWAQVLTSELEGDQFLAQRVRPTGQYFYNYIGYLVYHYDPSLVALGYLDPTWNLDLLKDVEVSFPRNVNYVILSRQGRDRTLNRWGQDPYQSWPETLQGRGATLVYSNGYFRIYATENALKGF